MATTISTPVGAGARTPKLVQGPRVSDYLRWSVDHKIIGVQYAVTAIIFFLIGGLLRRLVYLSLGLSVILAFIGVKQVLHALHHYHLAEWAPFRGEIPIWVSLTMIVLTLTVTTIASLIKSRYDADTKTAEPSRTA